jgi:sirohydrochlorin ferrochelatase
MSVMLCVPAPPEWRGVVDWARARGAVVEVSFFVAGRHVRW